MNFETLTRFSPLTMIPFLLACRVEIYHSPRPAVDHYVSMTLSESMGRREILANECIDLWDSSHGGSIDVDSPWLSADLRIDWRNLGGHIDLEVSDAWGPLSSHSFDEDYFQKGGSSELSIVTDSRDYLLQLSGPYCTSL